MKGFKVSMRERRWSSSNDRPTRQRHLSPIARIGILLPIVLILLVYTKAGDVIPRYASQWFAAHWFTDTKLVFVSTVKASESTFSRSWYIESSVASKSVDMQALGQRDAQWTLTSQQCNGNHYASLV